MNKTGDYRMAFAACAAALVALTLLSGCIDVHTAKEIFLPDRPVEVRYSNRVVGVSHAFTTSVNSPSTTIYENTTAFSVKNATKEMAVNITVTLKTTAEIFGGTPVQNASLFSDILRQLEMLNSSLSQFTAVFPFVVAFINMSALESLQLSQTQMVENITKMVRESVEDTARYVNVTITRPNGTVYYQNRFNQSDTLQLNMERFPSEGEWSVHVEAVGIGFTIDTAAYQYSYHDSYAITIGLNEPQ